MYYVHVRVQEKMLKHTCTCACIYRRKTGSHIIHVADRLVLTNSLESFTNQSSELQEARDDHGRKQS